MPILDILKKKKIKSEKEPKKGKEGLLGPKAGESSEKAGGETLKKEKEVQKETRTPKIKTAETAFRILKIPHVTEKATALAGKNQYVFKVFPSSVKAEIKKAVEAVFGVEVVGVRIINVPRRKRKLGKTQGWRKGYKKAVVRIKEGQKIEILPR